MELNTRVINVNGTIMDYTKDYDLLPDDYGKYIELPKIQDKFRDFLNKKDKEESPNHEYYFNAESVSNLSEKIRILGDGVKNGDSLCELELGRIYYTGDFGCKVDLKKAEEHLKKSVEYGSARGMYYLALLYYNSLDSGEKITYSLDLLCKSAICGCIESYFALERLYNTGNSEFQMIVDAKISVHFKKICDKNDRTGWENRFYGWCKYAGICCKKNRQVAKECWEYVEKNQYAPGTSILLQEYFQNDNNPIADEELKKKTLDSKNEPVDNRIENKSDDTILSIASLLIGIFSFCGTPFLSIIGLIISIKAIKREDDIKAKIGLVLNGLGLIYLCIALLLLK